MLLPQVGACCDAVGVTAGVLRAQVAGVVPAPQPWHDSS